MKILLPLITYNHTCLTEFMMSIMQFVVMCKDANIPLVVIPITFESLIQRARNACVAMFLSDPEFTHLLFVDGDIEFNAEDLMRLIMTNQPVVGAAYPQKWISHELYKAATAANISNPLEVATKMSVHLKHQPMAPLLEADYVTTGFLCIQRMVFEKMMAAYPQRKYKNDIDGYSSTNPDMFYDFFPVEIHPETRRFESEDYGFSRLWTSLGGKIHVLADVSLKHHGWFGYPGNLWRQLQVQAQQQQAHASTPY